MAVMPFLVTARAENILYGRPDLDDTINRLQAFSKAGADVLYASGLTIGVKRVSVGGSFVRAAMGEFIRAAQEVKNDRTFFYADRAISDSDARALMSGKKRSGNSQ